MDIGLWRHKMSKHRNYLHIPSNTSQRKPLKSLDCVIQRKMYILKDWNLECLHVFQMVYPHT